MGRLRENLIPPSGLPFQLATQNLLFGIGRGAFLTGSAVYFTSLVGLKPWQVGVGLSVSAATAMVTAVPLSAFADRNGPRMTWFYGAIATGALFALYPVIHGFWAFIALVIALELTNTISNAGRVVYMIEALDPKTRVITQAFGRSWLNIGWGLGALVAAAALTIDTPIAYHAMVFVNVAVMAINAWFIYRLPATIHETNAPRPRVDNRQVFKDRAFISVATVLAIIGIHGTVSLEVAPLWLVTHTDAPNWTLALLTGVNTVMATTMQVAMTRGSHTIAGARRVARWAGWIGAACCPIFLLSGFTPVWVAMALLVLATILVTMSELWQSAAAWTLTAELAPVNRKGEYQGAWRTVSSAQHMMAPAALIALAVTTGGWGWFVIAGFFVAASLTVGPAVDWAERTRPRLNDGSGIPTSRVNAASPAASAVE